MYFEVTEIPIDNTSTSNKEWEKIMSVKLRHASYFEIHCWDEEWKEIEMALQYGRIKQTGVMKKCLPVPLQKNLLITFCPFPSLQKLRHTIR